MVITVEERLALSIRRKPRARDIGIGIDRKD